MDMSFITDDALLQMVERDLEEVRICQQHGAYKATMVLAGSVVEAVLADYFLTDPPRDVTREKVLRAELGQLIDWAEQAGLISAQIRSVADGVRLYRNVIHPGREFREEQEVSADMAQVVTALMSAVVRAVERRRVGPRPAEVIQRATSDRSFQAVAGHVVSGISPENQRRLLRLLPRAAIAVGLDPVGQAGLMAVVDGLQPVVCHSDIRQVMEGVYGKLTEWRGWDVLLAFGPWMNCLHLMTGDQANAMVGLILAELESTDHESLGVVSCCGLLSRIVYGVIGEHREDLLLSMEELWRVNRDVFVHIADEVARLDVFDERVLVELCLRLERRRERWALEAAQYLRHEHIGDEGLVTD